jgi:hypothetical protein
VALHSFITNTADNKVVGNGKYSYTQDFFGGFDGLGMRDMHDGS